MPLNLAEKFKLYLTNIWFLWALSLVFNIITLLFLHFKIHPEGKILALHYNVLIGVEWYGKGMNLYLLPLVGFVIMSVNFFLYRFLKNNQIFLSQLLAFSSVCAQTFLLAAALFLARVN